MVRKIALLASAGLLAASVASAQTPPPGNVNPGSMKSGAEQSGAESQPRSTGGQKGSTTGSGATMTAPSKGGAATKDGVNANTKPSSMESGSEPAGQPANQRR